MSEKFSLKDFLFNQEKVEKIATDIKTVYPDFQLQQFVNETTNAFPSLELKERIRFIAQMLKKYLPSQYPLAVEILLKALPEPNNPDLSDDDFGDFIYASFNEFVAQNGCNDEYLEISLNALYQITQRFSAEDAIRYFINRNPKQVLEILIQWSKDKNYHIRRLTSEGTRPKLPWSQKINLDIEKPIEILNELYKDSTRFVTRSVANHLNDISKTKPDLTLQTLKNWKQKGEQSEKEMSYIINHSLRTLIKQGNKQALAMIGFRENPKIEITNFQVSEKVIVGKELIFSFEIECLQDCNLLIDYEIYFQNKLAKLASKKVFKLKQIKAKQKDKVFITKKHLFKKNMTTRTFYPGEHQIAIQINGSQLLKKSFCLQIN